MSSTRPSMHTFVENSRPTKKARSDMPLPEYAMTGIANAIIDENKEHVFLLKGDRHFWTDEIKKAWAELFWPKSDTCKGAPYQVYTVQDRLTFVGTTYTSLQQARFILEHMMSKKWFPKCCFEECDSYDMSSVTDAQLTTLFGHLVDFTNRVSDLHYHELVMGAIDEGPTMDMDIVRRTLYKESYEEAGLKSTELDSRVQHVGYSDPFTSRKTGETFVTAMYISPFGDKERMERIWQQTEKHRRPEGYLGWRCPHPWYKVIPGIDKSVAAEEKAQQETQGGEWVPIAEAMHRPFFMDDKNKQVLTKILTLI